MLDNKQFRPLAASQTHALAPCGSSPAQIMAKTHEVTKNLHAQKLEVGMSDSGLHPSLDIAAANWFKPRLLPFASAVAAVVPEGFPAYLRIPHPTPGDGSDPPLGNLPADLLRILCATLAAHTSTASMCYFCLWDGYGWLQGGPAVAILTRRGSNGAPALAPALSPEQWYGPRIRLPNREYLLFTGPLAAAPELGATIGETFRPQSPNLFWPQDHAWCVASDIDLSCTFVAGSQRLAEALVADPSLQASQLESGDSLTEDTDQTYR
jgi:hypothetical protein